MIEYKLENTFLEKLLRDTSEQPTALYLFLDIVRKAAVKNRTFMGREVIVGQLCYECKTEPQVFGCSRKQWKRDKTLLLDLHYITIDSDNTVATVTVQQYNDILQFSNP